MKKVFSVLITGLILFLSSTLQVSAQPLVTSTPTGTLTGGVNISINPEDPLPANGTVSVSTEGAIDSDMNVIPPEGVTVIISNDTVIVTNQTVDIETVDEDEDENTNDIDDNDDSNSNDSNGENAEGNNEEDEDDNGSEDEDSGDNEDNENGDGDNDGEENGDGDNDSGPVDFGPGGPVD
jgi:hypothetical protein